ncbi:MAG TPA: hypothetical protein DCW68_00110 [Rhodospirillaceae bacterium]|nr:MAG: hypothetical protein A2018_01420 [Alphaproteobacteria bacterium GWF2_58_20]HAU28503.1 hypothetical protein [Rhodospirillaceae bacterium]
MIFCGFYKSDVGEFLVGIRNVRLCWVFPVQEARRDVARAALEAFAKGEGVAEDSARVAPLMEAAMDWALFRKGASPDLDFSGGTDFQRQVWNTLLEIAPGEVMTYGAMARKLARPGAARAVARAAGANVLAVVVPCHRLVGMQGVGGYRWGMKLKKALLEWEKALHAS